MALVDGPRAPLTSVVTKRQLRVPMGGALLLVGGALLLVRSEACVQVSESFWKEPEAMGPNAFNVCHKEDAAVQTPEFEREEL